jgi:hypothetical protein
VDNFDGLSIHDIVAVFLNSWIVGVPFLEVNINVVVRHRLSNGGGGVSGVGGGGCLLPSWKNKFFWLHDDF